MEIIFTSHAEFRMRKRNLSREDVLDALKHPDTTRRKHGLYFAQKDIGRGSIEICYERTVKYIKIVTLYWI